MAAAADVAVEVKKLEALGAERAMALLAIERIDHGRYFECAACGDTIPEKWLAQVPWAVRCAACQERTDAAAAAGVNMDEEEVAVER